MKELFIAEYERYIAELIDEGLSEEDAMARADAEADHVYDCTMNRLADLADYYRKRKLEEGR